MHYPYINLAYEIYKNSLNAQGDVMKKMYLGIFACCFLGALHAAEAAPSGKTADEPSAAKPLGAATRPFSILQPFRKNSVATSPQATLPEAAVTRPTSPVAQTAPSIATVAHPAHQITISPKAVITRSASPAAQAAPSIAAATELQATRPLEVLTRRATSPVAPASFSLQARDDDDDARTVRADGEGYESDGSTFDDAIHIAAETLSASRFFGGYGYPKVCALVAAIKKESIPTTGKRAKIQHTPAFLASALSDINTTATAEEFDIIFGFVTEKNSKGAKLVSRHHLSGTRDAAKRHEEAALTAAQLDEKATNAQDVRVQTARTVLAAEEAKLAACKEKTLAHVPKLARREATTHAVQALMRVERPQLLFGKLELPEEEEAAAKLIPADLLYEDLIGAMKRRQELLRPAPAAGGAASSAGAQLK